MCPVTVSNVNVGVNPIVPAVPAHIKEDVPVAENVPVVEKVPAAENVPVLENVPVVENVTVEEDVPEQGIVLTMLDPIPTVAATSVIHQDINAQSYEICAF
jgi:hypothetical protein